MNDDFEAGAVTETAGLRGLVQLALEGFQNARRRRKRKQAAIELQNVRLLLVDVEDDDFHDAWDKIRGGTLDEALYDVREAEVTWQELDEAARVIVELIDRVGMGLQRQGLDELEAREKEFLDELDQLAHPELAQGEETIVEVVP